MTRPSEASVVPIRLTVDGRAGLTLWATPWIEDGEEWQAFLGSGQRVLVFGTAAELVAYLRSGAENDLTDHPQWDMLATLPADQLLPEEGHDFDLDGVYDLAATDPDPYTVSELSDLVDIVQRIAECCDDGTLLRVVEDAPEFAELLSDEVSYSGPDGQERWSALGKVLDRSWELVLDRLQRLLEWRGSVVTVDEDGGETVVEGAADPAGERVDVDEDGADRDAGRVVGAAGPMAADDPARTGPDGEQYDVWEIAGITPVRAVLPAGTGYTLRTYAGPDEEATFLGSDLTVDVFRSEEGLVAFCREASDHDLAEMVTWPDIQEADPLEVRIAEEDDFDLTRPSPQALELAADLAEYCRLEAVEDALDGDEPPADWDAVVAEISTCLRWHD